MPSWFESVVGKANVRRGDGESLDGVPVVEAVRPGDAGEVAACLAAAREAGLALVASGGGTRLDWGNAPRATELVRLDVSRLDALELEPAEGIVTSGAGVRLGALAAAARAAGQVTLLGATPDGASVGGCIAADPPGPQLSLGRRLRNDLLGLEVALPDGSLTRCGGRVVKNVTGFDLVRLYCGSLGTLGVITRATLRLRPVPETARALARECASTGDACRSARALADARVDPDGVAVLPRASGALLVWRLEGSQRDVEERAGRFEGEGADAAWDEARARAEGAGADHGAARVRLATRPSDARALMEALSSVGRASLALPLAGVAWAEVPEDAVPAVLEGAARERRAAFVERASPALKARVDVFGGAPDSLELMRGLKARFDPAGVLAPGRFLGRL